MLLSLMDGRARTATELAILAEVAPSTASVHLQCLREQRLVEARVQGRHRYYSLAGPQVARALESLSVLAGTPRAAFVPNTPNRLRAARSCYDHIAGALGVAIHDRLKSTGCFRTRPGGRAGQYELTPEGGDQFRELGISMEAVRRERRRFAFACLDWSERRPHLGGALAAALLRLALEKGWVEREPDDRALAVTLRGRRELRSRLQIEA